MSTLNLPFPSNLQQSTTYSLDPCALSSFPTHTHLLIDTVLIPMRRSNSTSTIIIVSALYYWYNSHTHPPMGVQCTILQYAPHLISLFPFPFPNSLVHNLFSLTWFALMFVPHS